MIDSNDNENLQDEEKPCRSGIESFLLHMAVGAVIGIGGILPGVSGGVIAVSLGLYRPMIDAVAGFFKAPKKNFFFLLPIGLGAGIGFLLCALVLNGIMEKYYTQVMFLFLGLVAGGVPSFIHEANERGFKPRYLIATLVGALLASAMLFLEKDTTAASAAAHLTPVQAIISGAVVSFGTVFPGISTSFILMYLGWYKPMMDAFSHIDIVTIIFLGIGAIACVLATIKAARWFFNRFHGYAYYAVLGFLVVSAALIFPGITISWGQLVSLVLAAGGFVGAYFLGKLSV